MIDQNNKFKFFKMGLIAMLPIISGIIPFGIVVGSVFANANLDFYQAVFMDTVVFAGAAQLATTELMKLNAAKFVVIASGLIINIRFILYSMAMAPIVKESNFWVKLFCALTLTDQSYAAMTANQHKLENNQQTVLFYLGNASGMVVIWHLSVIVGFVFGNIAPSSLSLDYAVPLSFIALLMPSLKSRKHRVVALFSSVCSIFFYSLPLKTGLMATALLSIALAWILIHRKKV